LPKTRKTKPLISEYMGSTFVKVLRRAKLRLYEALPSIATLLYEKNNLCKKKEYDVKV